MNWSTMTRLDLAKEFADEGYKVGVEVGVERGHYSKVLLVENPKLHLYCVDAWAAYDGYREHVPQERLDGFYLETDARLNSVAPGRYTLIREYSLKAAQSFEEESLDFVYLDANHTYDDVTADLEAWAPKVRPGGIVSGHDYCHRSSLNYGVIEAVDDYAAHHGVSLFILKGDRSPSWMWIVA